MGQAVPGLFVPTDAPSTHWGEIHCFRDVLVSRAAITKDHKLSGLGEHKCVPKPGNPKARCQQARALSEVPGEHLPLPLPNFRWLQIILGLAITCHSSLCLHQHMALFLSVSIFRSPLSCKDANPSGFRAHSNPAWTNLHVMTSAKTLFPNVSFTGTQETGIWGRTLFSSVELLW